MNSLEHIYQELGEHICLYPFFGAFYQTNDVVNPNTIVPNTVRPCSVIRYDKLSDWNVENENITETRNNQRWRQLRQDFLDGKFHSIPDCQGCASNECAGATSPRVMNNQFYSQFLNFDIVDAVRNQIDNKCKDIITLDYYPSNYCNFSCIMCAGGASSQRHTFEIKVLKHNTTKIQLNAPDTDFYEVLKTVQVINFTGGETVLQKQVHEVMDYLIEQGLSSNILITLLSNGSSSPAPLVEKYRKFRGVIYNVSIDGVGDVIEYQRRGCDWAEVEANALELMKHELIVCVMNFVLSAVNALNVMDYVDWCFANKLGPEMDNNSRVYYNISPIFRVDHLGVGALPLELRELALSRLAQGRERYQQMASTPMTQYFIGVIDQFVTVINNTAHNPNYLQPFIEHILQEDSVSKKTLAQAVPEWAPYFQF